MPEYIAIGDIHGMNELLGDLLTRLPSEGEIVFLGDYIDRGPDTPGVISRLLQLEDERHCRFLRGNHEAMMIAALDGNLPMEQCWLSNGGLQVLESYDGRPWPEHERFIRETELYYETEKYLFIHAGLVPGKKLAEIGPDEYLWIREPFISSTCNWGRMIIHGHTPTGKPTPDIRANRINIDTGAVYGGALTAVLLPENTTISVRK